MSGPGAILLWMALGSTTGPVKGPKTVWLVIGASDPSPAGIARVAKGLAGKAPGGLVFQTRDCGDQRNVFGFALAVADSVDSSVTHISRLMREARRRGASVIEVTQAAQERHMARIRHRAPRMVLYAGNCASSNTYYFDRHGDSPAAPAPSSPTENFWRTRFFRLSAYRFSGRAGNAEASLSGGPNFICAADHPSDNEPSVPEHVGNLGATPTREA